MKLEAAETKLHDLKSNTAKLGKEAAASMAAVEAQQQRLTLQRIIALVGLSVKLFLTQFLFAIIFQQKQEFLFLVK